MADVFERVVESSEHADPHTIAGLLAYKCTLCEGPIYSVQCFVPDEIEFYTPFVVDAGSDIEVIYLGLCARCYQAPEMWQQAVRRVMWDRRSQILN